MVDSQFSLSHLVCLLVFLWLGCNDVGFQESVVSEEFYQLLEFVDMFIMVGLVASNQGSVPFYSMLPTLIHVTPSKQRDM